MQRVLLAAVACFLAVIVSAPVNAQVLYGSIVGSVEDTSGALIPGATVTISNLSTGQMREARANNLGAYSFVDIAPGVYEIKVSAGGFKTATTKGVTVTINTVARVDVQLEVGSLTEAITVAADATMLQADKADVHVALTTKEVAELPLGNYRSFQTLFNLVPGTTPAGYQNSLAGSPGRSLVTNVNGTTNSNNNTRLDGASNMRASLPHQSLYVPPVESIEVVNIATNSFDAEQGFAGGAAVTVATKSGTNAYHGVLFEYHTNSHLKAKNFFYTDSTLPKYIINTYGGTFGGPIQRNRLFFFGSWEGTKERSNFSRFATIPDAKQRTGDFSGYNVTLYDPATGAANGTGRTTFAGNIIPLTRQSGITRKMQALLPDPNMSGTSNNYFASAPVIFNRDNFDGKLNWIQSEKTSWWAKYSAMNAHVIGQFSLGKAGGAGLLNGGSAGTSDVLVHVAAIGGVHTFSPTFLVDGNVAFSRDPLSLVPPDSGTNYGLDVLGIPGTNGPDVRYSGIPMFNISGYETMGNSETYMPKYVRNTYFTYTLNFGLTRGSHEMRFGIDVARYRVNQWHPELGGGPRGSFTFGPGVTGLNGGPATNQFNGYAAFLLGLPSSISKSMQPADTTPRQWLEGLYFRDRWQLRRDLTVTLGMRWEYYPLMTRDHTGLERYDPETNKVYVGGMGGVDENAGITVSNKLFAPRIGLAYRAGQKTVFRTGFGISINPYTLSTAESLLFPYPVSINNDYSGPNSYTPYGPIENGIPSGQFPDISKGTLDIPLKTSTVTLDKGLFRRGYVESFNFIAERQLPGGFVGSAGYVGTRTIRQGVRYNINASLPGMGDAGRPLNQKFGRTADTQVFRPFLGAAYNSLQARLDRQFSNGILMKVAYTYAKALDYTDGEGGTLMWNDPSQLDRNWAPAGYDRTHTFRSAFVSELPFGNGKRWANTDRIARFVLGGWQINGILSSYTGTPFTVSASGTSLNAPGQSQTADQIKDTVARLGGVGRNMPFYDPTAFVPVTRVGYGTSGRNVLRGPGLVNLDAGLFRTFGLTERMRLQFRAEAFNLSNTPHFGNPSANVSSGGFMTITSASSSSNNVEGGERVLRFALRLSF